MLSTALDSKTSLDTKKEFLTTCIQLLQETIQLKAETQPQCPFPQYTAQKLSGLDRRSRAIAEIRISDIIFDLELNSQSLNAWPTYQVDKGEPVQYMTLLKRGQDPHGGPRQ